MVYGSHDGLTTIATFTFPTTIGWVIFPRWRFRASSCAVWLVPFSAQYPNLRFDEIARMVILTPIWELENRSLTITKLFPAHFVDPPHQFTDRQPADSRLDGYWRRFWQFVPPPFARQRSEPSLVTKRYRD
jgi:hypothetical protein